jgi:predicted amidohydrolase YtcJ
MEHADMVVRDARVVTVDPNFSIVEAFAVTGGRIVALGSTTDINAFVGPDTQVLDLAGRTVLPGFVDAHPHTIHRALVSLAKPDLAGADTTAEVVRRIAAEAERTPPGTWIMTTPLGDPPDYFPGQQPRVTRADLDPVTPDHPVYVPTPAYWPHPALLNARALEVLDPVDEPGVRVDRDTGLVHGLHIFQPSKLLAATFQRIPMPGPAERQDAMARAFQENLTYGITAGYEAHGNAFIPDLHELAAAKRLPHRVVAAYDVPPHGLETWMAEVTTGGDDLLRVNGITVGVDGPPQFGLSLMSKPYRGPDGETTSGRTALTVDRLVDIARLAVRHNHRLNIVAAGDVACTMVVDALTTVDAETPLSSRQWVLQHFFNPTREQAATLKAMGIVVQTYTSIDYSRGEQVYIDWMGGDGWRTVAPLRWWIDAGVPVALASDGGHVNPMFQIWTALRRVDGRTGRSLMTPAKSVTRREVVTAYTLNGAIVMGMADRIGSLEPGKLADFAVLDRDILTCPVDDIKDGRAVLAALGGEVVWDGR